MVLAFGACLYVYRLSRVIVIVLSSSHDDDE
jgi:hypothetical protein